MNQTIESHNDPTISITDVVRPTLVEVNLDRLEHNFRAIQKNVAPANVMPILKANAYGHGLVRVARLMQKLGANYMGVAVLEEGVLLREIGITMPILVMGGILGNQIPHFLKYNLTITASSVEKLLQIDRTAHDMGVCAKVHLKVDTGMERIGIHYYNADKLQNASLQCRHVQVEGIFSHFANSESQELSYARLQLQRFEQVLDFYDRQRIPRPPLCHMANSGAILQMPEARFDMVRPGILLYGVYPSTEVMHSIAVKPVMSWKSRVVYFKVILPEHPVGYGCSWNTDHPVRAVTVPVGYGDGYFRTMSSQAHVLIHGKKYPVIGAISMDQIVVNIESDSAFNGDEVVLLGEQNGDCIRCENLSQWAGTIPYEILTNINTRVPRVYVSEQSH